MLAADQPVSRTYPRRLRMSNPRQEIGLLIGPTEVLLWNVMSLIADVGDHQLRGAYGTHDDGNPCQTSTDTECPLSERCPLSAHELTATGGRLLACLGVLNRPDKAEVNGSSPLRPTPSPSGQRQFHTCDSDLLVYGPR